MNIKPLIEQVDEWVEAKKVPRHVGRRPEEIKKIINGSTYNTTTAAKLAYFWPGHTEDYEWFEETLYKTRNGAFFLVGEGMSHYSPYWAAIPRTRDTMRGYSLIPLTQDETKAWLELRSLTEAYVELFDTPDEAAPSTGEVYTFTLRIPGVLADRAKRALKGGESLNAFIQTALAKECEARK